MSLKDVDMITGRITVLGYVMASWTDQQLVWKISDYSGLYRFALSLEEIWTPELTQYYVAGMLLSAWLCHTGKVILYVETIIEGFCRLDMFRYPLDEHSCYVSSPSKHDVTEIHLKILHRSTLFISI